MVDAYFDSGVLVKNYCDESNSAEAISLILSQGVPLPLTPLQEAEVRNALRLKLFRKEIDAVILKRALAALDDDIEEGRFERPEQTTASTFFRAENLSQRYSATTGARIIDILHVAAALEMKAATFVSFDHRQRSVAQKAGLRVLPRNA